MIEKYYQTILKCLCSLPMAAVTVLLVGSDIDPAVTSKS